jgi:hypothetical protein
VIAHFFFPLGLDFQLTFFEEVFLAVAALPAFVLH